MSRTSERRLGPDQGHRDADGEHAHRSTPTDAEALEAFRSLRAPLGVLCDWLGVGSTPATYTADALPSEIKSRDAFLRLHQRQVKAHAHGWTRAGQVRAVSVEAWTAYIEETNRPRAPRKLAIVQPIAPARDLVAEAFAAFGVERVRRP